MRRTSLAGLLASISQVVCAQPGDEAIARFNSCLQQEGAARLECFDKRLRELSEDNAPAAGQSSGGNWVISETTSPVDYSPQITATVFSAASAVKDAPSTFAIRCRRQRLELIVSTNGSWRPVTNFKVSYRIDNQSPVEEQWVALPDGRGAIFQGDVSRLLRILSKGERLSIRVYDWQRPMHEATFQIRGIDFVQQKIAAICK